MRLEKIIRAEARRDEYYGGIRMRSRSDAEVFFWYAFLWALLPLWGPLHILSHLAAKLGRRLR